MAQTSRQERLVIKENVKKKKKKKETFALFSLFDHISLLLIIHICLAFTCCHARKAHTGFPVGNLSKIRPNSSQGLMKD